MDTVKGLLEYYSHNWMTPNYMHHLLEGLAEIFSFPLLLRKCNILLSSLLTHIYNHVHVPVKHSSLSIQKSRLSNWTSLWAGPLFGERVKKSQGEGKERVRGCRQTCETVIPQHLLCISSWCKLLLARTLAVNRFDLHCFFGWHVACDLI